MFSKLSPVFDRPILRFAAAAGMKRDDRLRGVTEKCPRKIAIGIRRIDFRGLIVQAKPELFQWSGQLSRGMLAPGQLRGSCKEAFDSAAFQVRFKNPARIEEVTNDQIETAEISDQLR